ncbi:MAG: exodeoxyribonuclease VII small subunit [Pseudomonadota bacterium]
MIDFEKSLAELEQLVAQLEKGDLPLEASLTAFERGVTLAQQCQAALKEAEQRVNILVQKNGQIDVQPYNESDTE